MIGVTTIRKSKMSLVKWGRKTIFDCNRIAEDRGGKCLSEEYINSSTKLMWECEYKHQWPATFNGIQSGTWCPFCRGIIKHTLSDCHTLAAKKNGKCLSTNYINTITKLNWKCSVGHQWSATYGNVQQGHWCPFCSKKAKHTIDDCRILAEKMGGKCLSVDYVNALTGLIWKCSDGHVWSARYNDIDQGHWCPGCSGSKNQKLLFSIVSDIFTDCVVLYNYSEFSWLITKSKQKQHIDIYVPHLKLAIEYDGEQHFKPVNFGGISNVRAEENFKKTKSLDLLKNEKITKHTQDIAYFIRFNYKEEMSKEYVLNVLLSKGIEIK